MDREAETKALEDVRRRLEQRFPWLHRDVVAAAVSLAHSRLRGPVRDFVPLLVEHAARDRLAMVERAEPGEVWAPHIPDGHDAAVLVEVVDVVEVVEAVEVAQTPEGLDTEEVH
ncbi:three-helix bundle dimerization domain-containing protein [Terrabacter sp. BE26]|uniref:three-helix bundle dimerization domain-containing protein n=1 Tax=Terrabacter sp. BE26 TaxID=2898152 RepID=UPI0035BE16F8